MRHTYCLSSLLLSFAVSLPLAACSGDPGETPGADAGLDEADAAPPGPAVGVEVCAAAGTDLDSAWTADNQHGEVVSMTTDPAGKVVLGSVDKSVKVWSFGFGGASPFEPPTYGTPYTPGPGIARALAFDDSGQWLIGVDDAGAASVWFADEGDLRLRHDFGDVALAAADMTFGDQVLLADTSFGGALRVWNAGDDTVGPTLETELWSVSAILHNENTYAVYVAGEIYGVPAVERRLDSDPSQLIDSWSDQTYNAQITRVAMLPDGVRLLVVAGDMVAVFNGTDLAAGPLHVAQVPFHTAIAVVPTVSGQWFATLGTEGTVRLFETETLTEVAQFSVPASVGLGLDATGELLIAGGSDGFLRGFRCSE